MGEEFTTGSDGALERQSGVRGRPPGSENGEKTPLAAVPGVPASKSMLQRALLAAAWKGGEYRLRFPVDPGPPGRQGSDVADLILALGPLGLCITPESDDEGGGVSWRLRAPGFADLGVVTMALGESGTSARLLTAALAFAGKPGFQRTLAVAGTLAARSSQALIDGLQKAGCRIDNEGPGTWPLGLQSVSMPKDLRLENPKSSQEVSALLYALAFQGGSTLTVLGDIPSAPYVEMTRGILRHFGAEIDTEEGVETRFVVQHREMSPGSTPACEPLEIAIESDASGAAVVWAAGVLSGKCVAVPMLARSSVQGDIRMLEILQEAGAQVESQAEDAWSARGPLQRPLNVDLSGTPDLAPPLVALAAALALGHFGSAQSSRITGLGTLQGKESPRLSVLCEALMSLGIPARHGPDWLDIPVGEHIEQPGTYQTKGDHRMAFAFALLSLIEPSIRIEGHECVSKSWPTFWDFWVRLSGRDPRQGASK